MNLEFDFEKKNDKKKIIENLKKSALFVKAFTHVSYLDEGKEKDSYENLEFLGGSVLNFLVTLFLFKKFPNYSEGEMSKLKQLMIREETLYLLSKECNFDSYILVGNTEKKNNNFPKVSIIADVFESFLAVLFLEKGLNEVLNFLSCTLFKWVEGKENIIWDYKSKLQEYCQSKKIRFHYITEFLKKTENNNQVFISTLYLDDYYQKEEERKSVHKDDEELKITILSEQKGKGFSKKEAEQNAAEKTLDKLLELKKTI